MLDICCDKGEPPMEADHLVVRHDRYADMSCKSMISPCVSLPRMIPPMKRPIPGPGGLFASKKPTLLANVNKVRSQPRSGPRGLKRMDVGGKPQYVDQCLIKGGHSAIMYLQADTRERVMRRGTSSFEATTRARKWNLVNTLLEQLNKKKKAIGETVPKTNRPVPHVTNAIMITSLPACLLQLPPLSAHGYYRVFVRSL